MSQIVFIICIIIVVCLYLLISKNNVETLKSNNKSDIYLNNKSNNFLQNNKNELKRFSDLSEEEHIHIILVENLNKFKRHLRNRINTLPYSSYPDARDIQRLLKRINNTTVITRNEHINSHGKHVIAQTHQKGEIIEICIYDKKHKRISNDINTMIYILLHELAHVMSISHNDHGDEFRAFFNFLINEAVECDIYNEVDYKTSPVNYCGQIINDTD